MKQPDSCLLSLLMLPISILVAIGFSLARSGILLLSWGWFVTPTWGMSPPSFAVLFALVTMGGVLRTGLRPADVAAKPSNTDTIAGWLATIYFLGLSWAVLYVTHLAM